MRINAVLTDDLIKKIDAVAKEQKKSRSKFIREASERYLTEYKREKEEEMRIKKFANAARIQDRLRKKGGAWDGVAAIRKWREKVG